MASDMSARTVSPHRDVTQWFAYKYSATSDKAGLTHHGSIYKITGQDALGLHGGIGLRGRSSNTSVYTHHGAALEYPVTPPDQIGARCCHTITSFGNTFQYNLLIGGRSSPAAPMKDCWLQSDGKWERVHDLPQPRFRHRTAAVVLPHDQYGVVVYGGKISATKIAIDTLLWDKKNGWQVLRYLRSEPMPRFGASFVRLGFNHGLLMGGMRQDGVVCQGLWKWRLMIRDNKVQGIHFRASTAFNASAGMWPWLNRFGASYSVIRDELLLIGGIARQGCIPRDYEILSIVGSFSAFNDYEKEMEFRVACVVPKIDQTTPRPFLVGHSTHYTATSTTLIVGGGATCFSFGAYWNPGLWLLQDRESGPNSIWAMVKPETKALTLPLRPSEVNSSSTFQWDPVESVSLQSNREFVRLLQEGVPKLIGDLDFGKCLSRWSPDYLLEKTPSSKEVIVHAAQSRTMNFQRKDFAYKSIPFHDFINQIQSDSSAHMYLRSISSTNPTSIPADLSTDWPEISSDFHLPAVLSVVKAYQHSSPLRISANVNMWLHYDVMANVLFQIRGTKKLILFPPSDLKYLSFPPGSTSSTIDIFQPVGDASAAEDKAQHIPNTHPYVAILRPGTAFYIPPLWAHTGTPLASQASTTRSSSAHASSSFSASAPTSTEISTPESHTTSHHLSTTTPPSQINPSVPPHPSTLPSPINISLNIFFRTLSPTKYPAGRNVYGNRDLAAYEDGRRDVDKILRRFLATSSKSTSDNIRSKEDDDAAAASTCTADPQLDMDSIPKDIIKAYLERLAGELQERADKL